MALSSSGVSSGSVPGAAGLASVAPGEVSADAVLSGCRSRTGTGEKLAAMAGMRAGRRSDVGHADASLPV